MWGELLMTMPAVREWAGLATGDLELSADDLRGRKGVLAFLKECEQRKQLARRKRSGTRNLWLLCESDLRLALQAVGGLEP